jgi:hypothetical protein
MVVKNEIRSGPFSGRSFWGGGIMFFGGIGYLDCEILKSKPSQGKYK